MLPHRYRFLIYMRNIGNIRYVFFRAWKVYLISTKKYFKNLSKSPFIEWKEETKEQNRLQSLAIQIFKKAINRGRLSAQVMITLITLKEYISLNCSLLK